MDPAARLKLLSQLEKESGGKLEMFFASYGLGEAYVAPGKGWGKAKHIASAMTEADRRGEGDVILSAAAAYFGLLADEQGAALDADANADDPHGSTQEPEVERRSGSAEARAMPPAIATPNSRPEDELRRFAFEMWNTTGEWPVARVVQRRIEREGGRLDVELTGRALDPTVGYLEQKHDGRVVLKVGGLIGIEDAERYLSAFVAAVRLAYRRYVDADGDETPVLSDDIVLKELSLDPEMMWRLYSLLDGESFLLESGGSSPEEKTFRRDISPQIRFFRDIQSIADYAQARDELLRPYNNSARASSTARSGLRRAFPGAGGTSAASERGSQVFHTVIFGGNAAIGPNASVQVNVVPGDLSTLIGFLERQGIDGLDREALVEAIRSDDESGDKDRPGVRVRDWLGRVSLKVAASGARVGEQTGAALIAAAIAKYLGLL